MKLVTVVVPIYNVEETLRECIQSIRNQTYRHLEVILVNDGSTDRSLEICKDMKNSDSRISIIDKKNGGLSSARNAGIDQATGEYICFIDSDDWIEKDFIQLLVQGIEEKQADISVVGIVKVTDFNKINFKTETFENWFEYSRKQAMKVLFTSNLISYSAWNKLYKRRLFTEIRYPIGMLMEDKATTYRLIDLADKIVVNTSTKYHYYLRQNSILRRSFNHKNFDSFEIHDQMVRFIDQKYPELSIYVRSRYVYEAIRMLMRMIESNYDNKTDFERCIKVISDNQWAVKSDNKMKKSIKLFSWLINVLPDVPNKLARSILLAKFFKRLETINK